MKRKSIACIIIFVMLFIMFGGNKAFAQTSNTKYFFMNVPNYVKKSTYVSDSETSYYESYYNYKYNGGYIDITGYVYKNSYISKAYTQADADKEAETIKGFGNNYSIIHKNILTIDGCPAKRITYKKVDSNGSYYISDVYEILSDHQITKIKILLGDNSAFIDSKDEKAMINSIKIKDTVTKYKGIPFTDVNQNDWFFDSVKYTYNKKMISGLNDYTFGPYNKLSRGMLVTILWRMEGSPSTKVNKFPDVKSSDWYYTAVNWAASKGIINGYGNGKFGPKDNITREQLCSILMNYAKYKGKNVSSRATITGFKDYSKIESYFRNSVSWCYAKKIIGGKENGTKIDPKGTATRAEAATMLMKYCTNVK